MNGRLAQHFFRHEFGRLVALLCRRVGMQHLNAVEDAVQAALLAALETWPPRWRARQARCVAVPRGPQPAA